MHTSSEFLAALFGEYDGPVTYDVAGQLTETEDRDFVDGETDLLFSLTFPDQTAPAVYRVLKGISDPDFYLNATLPVTAALYNNEDQVMLVFWALECPWAVEHLQALTEGLECDIARMLPAPPTDGWACVFADPNIFYAFDELVDTYGLSPEEGDGLNLGEPTADANDASADPVVEPRDAPSTWADAVIMTPGYDPDTDPNLHREIVVSRGANAESKSWKAKSIPAGQFFAQLCMHKVGGKDGVAFVGGEVVGERRTANAMKALYVVGLDVDNGMASSVIDDILMDLGALAVRYTTHSHLSSVIEIAKDKVVKFADGRQIDTALCRAYLAEIGRYDARIVDTAEFDEIEHGDRGIVVRIETAPIPKNRIVFLLKEPFVVADEGVSQRAALDKWKKIPETLAQRLGIPIDRTGIDPSRLFFYPRHKTNAPFEVALFGGEPLDWRTLDLDNPFEQLASELESKKTKSKTDHGLGRWSMRRAHGFQIEDVLRDHCPDKVRSPASFGVNIECPNDEEHSNAGDPEDQACFAVNAGDGKSEFFTIKCQHDGCRDLTNLDMLGKMLAHGWFGREVLADERYNAAAADASAPAAATPPWEEDGEASAPETGSPATPQTTEEWLATLTKGSQGDEVMDVIDVLAPTLTTRMQVDVLVRDLRRVTGLSAAMLRKEVFHRWQPPESDEISGEEVFDKKTGRTIFKYYSAFNIDEALNCCKRVIRKVNSDNGMPHFTCMFDMPMMLREQDDSAKGAFRFDEINAAKFWAEISDRVIFQRKTDAGDGAREQVPKDVAQQFHLTAWKTLDPTPEIVYTPLFTEGGVLLNQRGWYEDLRIFLWPEESLAVPEISAIPSEEEVQDAVAYLRSELFTDFPFLDMALDGTMRKEPSEANAFAMLITPFMRRMIDSCTPLFFASKPLAGSGGSLLSKLSMLIFDGYESFPMSYSRDNDDEMRKALLSAVMETRTHLWFDDVREFNNRVLIQSITSRKIGGRILGRSENAERANNFIWCASGNNPFVGAEMERRIVWIRINAQTDNIQDRVYRHANLPEFIRENRGQIIWCLLTMIQSWIANGQARWTDRSLASFEDWAAQIGGVLANAGIEGFLDNRRAASADLDYATTHDFIKLWYEKKGANPIKVKELIEWAIDAKLDIVEGPTEDQQKARLRRKLEGLEGQTFDLNGKGAMIAKGLGSDGSPTYTLMILPDKKHEQLEAA